MTQEEKEPKPRDLTKHDFYFETPLYEPIQISQLVPEAFRDDVDAYSAENSTETTYSISILGIDTWNQWVPAEGSSTTVGFFLITLKCRRKSNDILRFFVYKDREVVMKVGQWPSIADLQFADIGRKYEKVLPKEDLRNLKKAIGLVAHGAGAGSFVYLRRIFENLIFDTFKQNSSSLGVPEVDFKLMRMEQKIDLLKPFLPSQLVSMKSIYGILSKGVHELTEDECLKYFGPIKLSIELILDQKIENVTKLERDTAVKKQLQEIQNEIASSTPASDH